MMHEKVMENLFDVVFGWKVVVVHCNGLWSEKVKLIQRQRQVQTFDRE